MEPPTLTSALNTVIYRVRSTSAGGWVGTLMRPGPEVIGQDSGEVLVEGEVWIHGVLGGAQGVLEGGTVWIHGVIGRIGGGGGTVR